jgi:hypothetical protein
MTVKGCELAREYERRAVADYAAVAGRVLMVDYLMGYIGNTDEQWEGYFDPPIAFRVDKACIPEQGLYHWCDEHLDPYWDGSVVDVNCPQLPEGGLRSCWMYGVSYNVETGAVDRGNWRFETRREKWSRWFHNLIGKGR